jgi:hypothetical protein
MIKYLNIIRLCTSYLCRLQSFTEIAATAGSMCSKTLYGAFYRPTFYIIYTSYIIYIFIRPLGQQ